MKTFDLIKTFCASLNILMYVLQTFSYNYDTNKLAIVIKLIINKGYNLKCFTGSFYVLKRKP